MKDGDVVLLENLRYHPEEEKNDEEFSKKLAGLADFSLTTRSVQRTGRMPRLWG